MLRKSHGKLDDKKCNTHKNEQMEIDNKANKDKKLLQCRHHKRTIKWSR